MSVNLRALSIALLLLFWSGCRRNVRLPENLEAYHITYRIDYLEEKAGDVPTRLLPAEMEAYFTDYFVMSRIEGFFRQFSLVQIADLQRKRVTTMLHFFGNKVYYEGKRGELPAAVVEPENLQFSYTGDTAVIGGLRSERIEVGTGTDRFNIYSTREFSVNQPNITTPYRSIDDPLSEFRVQLSLLKMHLTCSEFETKIVGSELFTVPEGYRQVSREAMEEIINSLFTKE